MSQSTTQPVTRRIIADITRMGDGVILRVDGRDIGWHPTEGWDNPPQRITPGQSPLTVRGCRIRRSTVTHMRDVVLPQQREEAESAERAASDPLMVLLDLPGMGNGPVAPPKGWDKIEADDPPALEDMIPPDEAYLLDIEDPHDEWDDAPLLDMTHDEYYHGGVAY